MSKPKFNVGDRVWVLEDKAVEKEIYGVVLKRNGEEKVWQYFLEIFLTSGESYSRNEAYIFSSKEELIISL